MRVAVVGHVEWVEFARVERVPRAGEIVHALETWEEPAGGGAVAAAQLTRLAGSCLFFTALGADELGRRSRSELTRLGIDLRAIPEADPRLLTRAVLGLHNSVWHWYRTGGDLTIDQVADFFVARCLAVLGLPVAAPATA